MPATTRGPLAALALCLLAAAGAAVALRLPPRTRPAAVDPASPENAASPENPADPGNAASLGSVKDSEVAESRKGLANPASATGAAAAGRRPAPRPRPPQEVAPVPGLAAAEPPAAGGQDDITTSLAAGPWDAQLEAAPAPHRLVCFEPLEDRRSLLSTAELQQWLTPAPGQAGEIGAAQTRLGAAARFTGLLRLAAPLPPDTAWRMALDQHDGLQIHLFHQLQGVTLTYNARRQDRWSAAVTTRRPGAARPETLALAARDNHRAWRAEVRQGGPLEIVWHAGRIHLIRGDLPLLSAPLQEPPQDVFLDGAAVAYNFQLRRVADWDALLAIESWFAAEDRNAKAATTAKTAKSPKTAKTAEERAAEDRIDLSQLQWDTAALGESLQLALEGSTLRLRGVATQPGWAFARLPIEGVREVVVQLRGGSPGVGVYLGSVAAPREAFCFVTNETDGSLCLARSSPNAAPTLQLDPRADAPLWASAESQWIGMLACCGGCRWRVGQDGVHWAAADAPPGDQTSSGLALGLFVAGSGGPVDVTLAELQLRPLSAINSLADPQLLEQFAAAGVAEADRLRLRPKQGDLAAWDRSWKVRQLSVGGDAALAAALESLLDESLLPDQALLSQALPDQALPDQALPDQALQPDAEPGDGGAPRGADRLATQLRLIAEASRLVCAQGDAGLRQRMLSRIVEAGLAAGPTPQASDSPSDSRSNGPAAAPESQAPQWQAPQWQARQAVMRLPLETNSPFPAGQDPQWKRILRSEACEYVARRDWDAAHDLAEWLLAFRQAEHCRMTTWLLATASRERPQQFAAGRSVPTAWRRPLDIELDKEAFNAVAELENLLSNALFADAARMVSSLAPSRGLTTHPRDDDLLLDLRAAVQLAAEAYPQLKGALQREADAVARLRSRQAEAREDVDAVRAVAELFPGAAAAAEARMWLGDRALAGGQFARAEEQYRRAVTDEPLLAARRAAGLAMARALQGRAVEAPAGGVEVGGAAYTAAEFQTLLDQLQSAGAAAGAAPPPVTPGRLSCEPHEKLQLQPQPDAAHRFAAADVDWTGRQTALQSHGDWLLLSDRMRLSAWSCSQNKLAWQTPAGEPRAVMKSREWPLAAMRPLVWKTREGSPPLVIVRRMDVQGPQLSAFRLESGALHWDCRLDEQEFAAADPVLVDRQLLLLTAQRETEAGGWRLDLRVVRPDEGVTSLRRPLCRLQEGWLRRRICEATAVADGVVFTLGGAAGYATSEGLRWVRQQPVLPVDEDLEWLNQAAIPPLVADRRVVTMQPGVASVECLDRDCGRLLWRRAAAETQQLFSSGGTLLYAQAARRIACWEIASGRTRWTVELPGVALQSWVAPSGSPAAGGAESGGAESGGAESGGAESGGAADGALVCAVRIAGAGADNDVRILWLSPRDGSLAGVAELPELADPAPQFGPLARRRDGWWVLFGRGRDATERQLLRIASP